MCVQCIGLLSSELQSAEVAAWGAYCSAREKAFGQVLLVVLLKDVLLLQVAKQHHDSVQHGVHLILIAALQRLHWQQ